MSFRRATMADAEILYEWRLLQEAQPWYVSGRTGFEEHLDWLKRRLTGPCMVLMWEPSGVAAGTVRIESDGSLSFHGHDPRMLEAVRLLRYQYGGRLKAVLDRDDPRGDQLARAGFVDYPARTMIYRGKLARPRS